VVLQGRDEVNLDQYRADLKHYQRLREAALEEGYTVEHPLVRLQTRRIAVVRRLIETLGGEAADDDTDQAL
jgi:nitroimidazol reductase NimA-like FMN-containing flavoprotein (pyridoxamine 5'-phosphate oxidase superfamily)